MAGCRFADDGQHDLGLDEPAAARPSSTPVCPVNFASFHILLYLLLGSESRHPGLLPSFLLRGVGFAHLSNNVRATNT